MRLHKFLFLTVFITSFSLLYVYQQTEILRQAYVGQKKTATFQDLLDKNSFLRYNIEKSASLTRIGSKISITSDYEMPDTYRLVKLNTNLENTRLSKHVIIKKESVFSRIFGIKRQAEAQTINP